MSKSSSRLTFPLHTRDSGSRLRPSGRPSATHRRTRSPVSPLLMSEWSRIRDNPVELEFEVNLKWLLAEATGGWVNSHFDIVDKFSPAERPGDRGVYTHKLNLELDTALAVFNWLPDGRWARGVELEGSLDYVATGLPRAGET